MSEISPQSVVAPTLPSGFEDTLITKVQQATALAFTPDGRMLITARLGQVRVYKDGALLGTPALDISGRVCNERERGLLGIAVDPDFQINHHVFLYYTDKRYGTCGTASLPNGPVNRVSRFTLQDNNTIDPGSEVIVIDEIPSPGAYHNAGGALLRQGQLPVRERRGRGLRLRRG